MSIVLHANWRGVPEVAHYSDGQVLKNGYSLAQMPLAGKNVDAYLGTFRPEEVASWFGSLITNQKDASGLLYRRNRYYDPGTGRFTQEDSIGLAGGMNLYGFGGGDPVNLRIRLGLGDALKRMKTHVKTQFHSRTNQLRTQFLEAFVGGQGSLKTESNGSEMRWVASRKQTKWI